MAASSLSKESSTNASSLQLFSYLPIKADPRPVGSLIDRDQGSVAGNLAIINTTHGLPDPLADPAGCRRDVYFLKDLQINVVRTYVIDPYQDHSKCMAVFSQAGIYVIADLMAPGYMIAAVDPLWNSVLYHHYITVIDTMHNYSNLLGFILGDDVINGISQDSSGPYVKAAVRDMKAYIRDRNYRPIPVGYVSSFYCNIDDHHVLPTAIPITSPDPIKFAVPIDVGIAEVRTSTSVAPTDIPDYLNCGDKRDNNIDFWGANIRSWCTGSNYTSSGYANATSDFSSFSVPVFLAAYGCPTASSRDFSEIVTIYGHLMSSVWSGGIIYQYFSHSDFEPGLVSFGTGGGVTTAGGYQNLSRHIVTVSPSSIHSASYSLINSAAACPVTAALNLPPNPVAASSAVIPPRITVPIYISTNGSIASNHALSTGGKVGIGIGLGFLLLALAVGTFLILKRAKRKKRIDQGQDQYAQWTRAELTADDVDREARGYGPHMAASTERAEAEDTGVMRETQVREIFEAPGDLATLHELSSRGRHGQEIL
ncbi:1,3-beta-glucanosyltransferase gas1 [Sticta canariensis]|nr:1,3-beta-glucanosyltransferase gas1 [Sticta canariensis]